MLINAQSPEELRIAVAHGNTLESYHVEVADAGMTRGNIYRGVIAGIQPSLNAAFIDYGAERNGFLSIQDVVPEAYYREPSGGRPRIEDVLEKGKPIVIQVSRDPEGQKGAALTTNLSLAGRYLVLTPFDSMRGVSRKVEDEDVRKELREIAHKLEVPEGCGLIVRTNALDQNRTVLARDVQALLRLWKRVQSEAIAGRQTKLLYSDQDLILRAIRDVLDSSIEEVLVDDDAAFEAAGEYMQAFLPRSKTTLVRYTERAPIFFRYGVEDQIDKIYERSVALPSGGSIVIDPTEALTAIDVNSGKSTRGGSQEETALQTNLEAAAEVARQLRMRDVGGLIVVDFIDMRSIKAKKKVEKAVKDAMKVDRARNNVGRISSNGLVEINRQRISQALRLRTHRACPTCAGTGRIASPEMVSLNLLRRIEGRAASGRLQSVRVSLHPELADALQNSRRQKLAALEREFQIEIEIIASSSLHRPDEKIEWIDRPGGAIVLPQKIGEAMALEFSAPAVAPAAPAHRDDKRRGAANQPAIQARELAIPAPEKRASAGAATETEAERKKKRRRGGRNRKKTGAGAEAPLDSKQVRTFGDEPGASESGDSFHDDFEDDADLDDLDAAEGEDSGAQEAGSVSESGEPETAAAKAKRRRRGGRKRKRGGRNGEGASPNGESGHSEAAGGEIAARPDDDEGDEDGGDEDGSVENAEGTDATAADRAKKRRPRRRGGRKRAAGKASAEGSEGEAAGSGEAQEGSAPETVAAPEVVPAPVAPIAFEPPPTFID
jgi:ribonuclease E